MVETVGRCLLCPAERNWGTKFKVGSALCPTTQSGLRTPLKLPHIFRARVSQFTYTCTLKACLSAVGWFQVGRLLLWWYYLNQIWWIAPYTETTSVTHPGLCTARLFVFCCLWRRVGLHFISAAYLAVALTEILILIIWLLLGNYVVSV